MEALVTGGEAVLGTDERERVRKTFFFFLMKTLCLFQSLIAAASV